MENVALLIRLKEKKNVIIIIPTAISNSTMLACLIRHSTLFKVMTMLS